MSAARHAVFAEGIAGLLEKAERLAATDVKDLDNKGILAKVSASNLIPLLREVLYPDD